MLRSLLGLLLLTALLLPGAARASGWDIVLDCRDELLSKTYTQAEYDEALDMFPADGREYSGCYQIILDAKRAAAREAARPDPPPAQDRRTSGAGKEPSGSANGDATAGAAAPPTADAGGPGTAAPDAPVPGGAVSAPYVAPTAADARALAGAADQGAHRLRVGGVALVPGLPAGTTSGLAGYPAPVLLLLAALAAAALLGLGPLVLRPRRRAVSGRRSSPSA